MKYVAVFTCFASLLAACGSTGDDDDKGTGVGNGLTPGASTAALGLNTFSIDGENVLAVLDVAVDIQSTPGGALATADQLTEEECLGAGTTNLVSITPGGGIAPAACAQIESAWGVNAGLVVKMNATFEVSTEMLNEDDEVVEVEVEERSLGAFLLVDYDNNAADLVGITEANPLLPDVPVIREFFAETDSGRLIFSRNRDGEGAPLVYEPLAGSSFVVSSGVTEISWVNYVTGNFIQWTNDAGQYQLYDVEKELRYSLGSSFVYATAVSDDVALVDGVGLFDMTDGSGGECEVRGGIYEVKRCTADSPCFEGQTDGAIMMSDACDGASSGAYGICHVTPDCQIESYYEGLPDTSRLVRPDPNVVDSRVSAEVGFLAQATDYWVFREGNSLTAITKADGTASLLAIVEPINLVYFATVGNTLYYAGETPAALPIYRAYDLVDGTETELTALEAADRIIALR